MHELARCAAQGPFVGRVRGAKPGQARPAAGSRVTAFLSLDTLLHRPGPHISLHMGAILRTLQQRESLSLSLSLSLIDGFRGWRLEQVVTLSFTSSAHISLTGRKRIWNASAEAAVD